MLYVTCYYYSLLYARQLQNLVSGAESRWRRFSNILILTIGVTHAVCDLMLLY